MNWVYSEGNSIGLLIWLRSIASVHICDFIILKNILVFLTNVHISMSRNFLKTYNGPNWPVVCACI